MPCQMIIYAFSTCTTKQTAYDLLILQNQKNSKKIGGKNVHI